MSWEKAALDIPHLHNRIVWVPDTNCRYRGISTVTHTEGATVWLTNMSGKPRWRIWMRSTSYLMQTFATEDEAKRYVEAMMPFVELQELK